MSACYGGREEHGMEAELERPPTALLATCKLAKRALFSYMVLQILSSFTHHLVSNLYAFIYFFLMKCNRRKCGFCARLHSFPKDRGL